MDNAIDSITQPHSTPVNEPGLNPAHHAFRRFESNVRSYCRRFPAVFSRARDSYLIDDEDNEYIDFFCGAGSLNYGHNNPVIKNALLDYLGTDAIVQSLDLYTPAKREFLLQFQREILEPRGYEYKVQFSGPAGTNAVEAALKLARKVTGRRSIVAFSNAFHGMSLGALGVSARSWKRSSAGTPLDGVIRMPFEGFLDDGVDSIQIIESMLFRTGSGNDRPAAIILETVQAEGGLNVASNLWLKRLADLAKAHDTLLIVDDIQTGCGRTGSFFSFEAAGIEPDLVCLSKSISGFGMPMSLVLIKPHLDKWEPGEHNATFRGNNLAFVGATAALSYWRNREFQPSLARHEQHIRQVLESIRLEAPEHVIEVRGRGLLQGLVFRDPKHAAEVSRIAFGIGLIVELCGAEDEVVKVMPPLTITETCLATGLDRLRQAVRRLR
ncbi:MULTISPECIES: diaminobutyrate--2-oxoglutarate transaminase [Paraburkholderia]|uniref:diaminobutyrate--2-oxoglutarate transaminase n=1 Tax=Paraburkholderia TaxID=1822464 RepID=UPI0022577D3F|nr:MULTISPECIES: diaminobutyrate--2-oxoglutarate transaminase [Paraburkholderia]MCX4165036.1 diaminobutyrate--2-oxoglutarate transaminase [Paraburkholderia megapolitana]MDN7160529.1 diaminobutyrate--2-oxoglutarate transaminase [Paraburkholderia sp. CHISQ3]MDQ6497576.1 diaminobutyrate--2-oxoglutarate transaminase [Paraburkholderia megapolitana]